MGADCRRNEHFLPPNQSRRVALVHDRLEEAAENRQPVALPNTRQARMVRKRLGQVVAKIPTQAQSVGDDAQELAFGAHALEEEDELQLEEDDRVNRRTARLSIGASDQVTHEGEI